MVSRRGRRQVLNWLSRSRFLVYANLCACRLSSPRFALPVVLQERRSMFRRFGSLLLVTVAIGLALVGTAGWSAQNAGATVLRSARSGTWSDPKTWEGGKVPGA